MSWPFRRQVFKLEMEVRKQRLKSEDTPPPVDSPHTWYQLQSAHLLLILRHHLPSNASRTFLSLPDCCLPLKITHLAANSHATHWNIKSAAPLRNTAQHPLCQSSHLRTQHPLCQSSHLRTQHPLCQSGHLRTQHPLCQSGHLRTQHPHCRPTLTASIK
ncbi:uncharacterized protein LOC116054145 isoform X2 [Sander lucioperca]|nr:uncharacterized protein LOC116054145 isoform X2 [Sander lucioperca]